MADFKDVLSVCFILLVLLALPIAQITIANQNLHNIACANDTTVLPTTWLLVSGWITIIFIVIIFMSIVASSRVSMLLTNFIFGIQVLIMCFFFAWLIVGAVVLWQDNPHCNPQSLLVVFYFSIIVGFLIVLWFLAVVLDFGNMGTIFKPISAYMPTATASS